MSMTREEAIERLSEQYNLCKGIYECSADPQKSYSDVPKFMEALGMALIALRPVSREQVEKAWRSKWIDTRESSKDVPTCMCSRCTRVIVGFESKFCPDCGSPMTDEAVDILLGRLEALKDAGD